MTPSELKSLLEKRAEKLHPKYDGTTCSSTRADAWRQGHASTHSLIQMLVQALEYYCHFKNREGDYTFRSDEGRKAFNTLEKLRAELETK